MEREIYNHFKVASVQFNVQSYYSLNEFEKHIEFSISQAIREQSDIIIFPEFFTLPLLKLPEAPTSKISSRVDWLTQIEDWFLNFLSSTAKQAKIDIIGGSFIARREEKNFNLCPIATRDGVLTLQPKIHVTPFERDYLNIQGGNELNVFQSQQARFGINICYDVEFPETSRRLSRQGMDVLFVPYCTEDKHGFHRVHDCAKSRAIENQIYVVTSGLCGEISGIEDMMDKHFAQSSIISPCDTGFPESGIYQMCSSQDEEILVQKLDIQKLHLLREHGTVRPQQDFRSDLFSI